MTSGLVALVTALALASAPQSGSATAPASGDAPAPTAAPAPADATAPATGPAPGWEDETPPTGPRPQPKNAGAPQPAATATPPAPVPPAHTVDDDPSHDPKRGRGLIAGGVTLIGVGALSLIAIAVPAAIVKRVAMNRAERDTVIDVQSREDRYRRARIADNTMEGGFWAGITGLGVGVTLTIVGAVLRSRARARANTKAQVAPTVGGLAVRF